MRIGMVGHGMMGVWHSDALKAIPGIELHTLVGRRAEPTAEFAGRYGYTRWTLDFAEMLADPAIDAVVIASPSEAHAEHALMAIAAKKPSLLEIPLAMNLVDAERVVDAATGAGVMIAMCHPMRFRAERDALRERVARGEETIRQISGRFFIHRLKNVGATGYQRSWTDNILWHHFCHFVDLGVQLLGDAPPKRVSSQMSLPHPLTGIPMNCTVLVETAADQSLLVHGSYESAYRLYDKLIVTDRDTYSFDILTGQLRTKDGVTQMEDEKTNCARVIRDFVQAVQHGIPPRAPVASALPAMRILDAVQRQWDEQHGARSLPGRKIAQGLSGRIQEIG